MDKMYNTYEAAQMLGLKVRTVREWIAQGKIKATHYMGGERWYISSAEIKRIAEGESPNGNKN